MKCKYILSLFMVLGLLGSCSKFIDVEPTHSIDGDFYFNSLDDVEAALIGAYAQMKSSNWFGDDTNPFLTLPDIISDNFRETNVSLANFTDHVNWSVVENDTRVANVWVAGYGVILRANIVLERVDQFAGEDQLRVNRIKAQAYAIRAMTHFDLMRYFVDNYDRNATTPGIPYVTTFDIQAKPGRGTVRESYDRIYEDVQMANSLFANIDQPINPSGRAYIDEFVVKAFMARMSLYNHNYEDAITYATDIINNFPLADRSRYPGIWTDANLDEVIWSYTFNTIQDGRIGSTIYFVPNDRLSFAVSADLQAEYDEDNDIRFESFIDTVGTPDLFIKYLAKTAQLGNPDGVVNFKVFRTSEMYLIRAEAHIRKASPDEGAALADLNALRAARIDGFVNGSESGAALEAAIALERRKELLGEGHRFFDLKRTTRTINRFNCTGNYCELLPGSRAWTWPIPDGEMRANPNIGDQNPGYTAP